MSPTPLWQYSAGALHHAFLTQQATPVQALQSCLDRIAQVQPQLNAFVAMRAEQALQEAQASTLRYQQACPLSVLDGVPVSIKDNLLTQDLPTTWGCSSLVGYQPAQEELAVTRLRQAGALIVGKTNVPEFTLEGYTDNPVFGVTRNPWNLALTPGGSSGGAAASVAAGCTPLALGTDGGGSIRRPAAHCGIVGLKPTIGTVARVDGLPRILLDFEVVGLMARSASDVQLLLSVVAGPDAQDPASWAAACQRQQFSPPEPASPPQLLYVPTLEDAPVDPAIAAACAQAATQLGCHSSTGSLPLQLGAINAGWSQVGHIGLAFLFAQAPQWAQQASHKYLDMAAQGAQVPATRLWALQEAVQQLRRDCARLFERWDVVAMPCTAAQPWPAQQAYPAEINGQTVGPRGHAAMTGWVNAAGLPAISIPVAFDAQGLPMGLQLIAAPGNEALLLELATRFAAQHPLRWPPLELSATAPA